ncbi:MAG TPA: type VI secretion system-associated FHA domain protein TagH [Caulobacteraceae bacterium]|nr:type VI secretion system-associated FHA domain protein TagH [Caulobacteraceae bacterium]
MTRLRLFHRDDPSSAIDERELGDGDLVVGRDREADWVIDDPSLSVSRRHCLIRRHQGALWVIDTSSNGLFFDTEGQPAPQGVPAAIRPGQTLRLGEYLIVAGAPGDDGPRSGETAIGVAPTAGRPARAGGPQAMPAEGALIEAFCQGAGLDPSSLSSVDSLAAMRRAGEVYREMVNGLAALMGQRAALKDSLRLEGTRIHAAGNNPFRWAPARRVAIDLLHQPEDGFLEGPGAVKASFADLSDHLTATLAGMRGAVTAILGELSPDAVESRLHGRLPLLRSRMSAAWEEYMAVHGALKANADRDLQALLEPKFRNAYEDGQRRLDAAGPAGA